MEPNKHFSAHKGRVYLVDTLGIHMSTGEVGFIGRAFRVEKGRVDANENSFNVTADMYLDSRKAFMAAQMMINKWDGLGKCFLKTAEFGKIK